MAYLTLDQRWAIIEHTIARIPQDGTDLLGLLAGQMKHLTRAQRDRLFDAVYGIQDERLRRPALGSLAPGAMYLTEPQIIQSLEVLLGVTDGSVRSSMAPSAPEAGDAANPWCEHIVRVLADIENEEERAEDLADLGTGLGPFSGGQRQRLLVLADSIVDPVLKLKAMVGLAAGFKDLTEEQRQMVLDLILDVENQAVSVDMRMAGISAVLGQMKHLSAAEQARVVGIAVRTRPALRRIWPHMADLSEEDRQTVIDATAAIERWTPEDLKEVAPVVEYLSDDQREPIVAAIHDSPIDSKVANILLKLGPAMAQFNREHQQRLLQRALAIESKRLKADVLVRLAIVARA